nr:RHS repeat protein [Parachlamydiaceae bacterium]
MHLIIRVILLSFIWNYLHANEEDIPEDFQEVYLKGDLKDIDQDISQMEFILSAEFEPLSVVAGCVNVSTGAFFQVDYDFSGDSIDPIQLTRIYDDKNYYETFLGFKFGCQYPLLATPTQNGARHSHALIEERNGFFIPYQGKSSEHFIDPYFFKKRYTNLSNGSPSAQSNHINWTATFNNGWRVAEGDGSQRIYNKHFKLIEERRLQLGVPTNNLYLLTEQIKSNGNRLKFDYQILNDKPCLSKVWTVNRKGETLNFIDFHYSEVGCTLKSSCGKLVEYLHTNSGKNRQFVYKKLLTKVNSNQKGTIAYDYSIWPLPNIYRVNKPDGRFVQVAFNDGKVSSLLQNNGTYLFTYKKHETLVEDPLGNTKSYQFDSNKRLKSIDYLEKELSARQEVYSWCEAPGAEGRLISKAIMLSNECFQLLAFSYDKKGNVIKKTVYGNLTGEKADSFKRIEGAEKYSTTYTYTKDNRNLLLSQSTPKGWMVTYDYLPETNLRTSILQSYDGKIQDRTFRTYDDNGEVRIQIDDDGSSIASDDMQDVSHRRIKQFFGITIPGISSFGKPHKILEGYIVDGRNQNLTSKVFKYDSQGREIEVWVFDSKNSCYITKKAYDSYGRVISETNPLNQETRFLYNDSNQVIEEELVGSGKITLYSYNSSGWMASKTENHTSGESFRTTYTYDAKGNLIEETDPYGHNIKYFYDYMGRQTKKIIVSDGAVYKKRYNILGQVISDADPKGNTIEYSYNIYGHKTKIIHPDGSIERFVYLKNGWLKQHWKADGTSIKYKYDPKGRIINKVTRGMNEEFLKEESFVYKGNLLIEKVDAKGLKTIYQYDDAGRKVIEKVGDRVTSYSYDGFDRITTIVHPLGAIENYTYDFLDRVTSKIMKDSQGNVYSKEIYTYDIHGNVIEKKCLQNEDNWISYRSQYGSDGKILWQEDPLGKRTIWEYDHHYINEKSQKVIACTIRDPMGRITIEVNDPCGRLARKDILENDLLVSTIEYVYDLSGKEIEKRTSIYVNGEHIRDFWVILTYDKRGRISSETEMPKGKTTCYTYDALGNLILKAKPDGVSIVYDYDFLGRPISISSDDVHYTYGYDLHDNPTEAFNQINNTIQKMSYDLYGNLIEEELHAGITLKYCYDDRDRITKVTFPDGSSIRYVYDPFYLVKVERYTPQGDLAYVCACPSYDLRGNCLQYDSPAGTVDYIYDKKDRKIKINSTFWESSSDEFDPVGNLLALTVKDPSGELKANFGYDRFNHLVKDLTNSYLYDSLGNCLQKNDQSFLINNLNQLITDSISIYSYDLNGNLIYQTKPDIAYTYDSLNRLKSAGQTLFEYDAFGRCFSIKDNYGERLILYQGFQEIGSIKNDQS